MAQATLKTKQTATAKAAKSATGKSGSDLQSRAPVSGKASADGSGHNGAALAVVFIKMAEEQGDAVAKVTNANAKSNKDKLRDLFKLTADDHIAFRLELEKRRLEIEKGAEKAGISIAAYREADPKEDYVYVQISTWRMLSTAMQNTFKPDMDLPWLQILSSARDHNNKVKAQEEQKKLHAELVKVQADTKMPKELKEATVLVLNQKMADAAIKANPRARTSTTTGTTTPTPTAAPKSLIALVEPLIKDRPVSEVEELFVWLGQFISTKTKSGARLVNETMKKHGENVGVPAPAAPPAATPPAVAPTREAANDHKEPRAAAAAHKRTTAKGRKSHK
jgi:hypothetical protein